MAEAVVDLIFAEVLYKDTAATVAQVYLEVLGKMTSPVLVENIYLEVLGKYPIPLEVSQVYIEVLGKEV